MANGWATDVDMTEIISLLQGGGLSSYSDLYDIYTDYQDLDQMGFGAWYGQGGHDLFQHVMPGLSDYQRELDRMDYTTQSDVNLARLEQTTGGGSGYSYSGFEGSGSGLKPIEKDTYKEVQKASDQARLIHRLEQRELGETMATDFWEGMSEFEESMDIDELSGDYGHYMDYNFWAYQDWDDVEALLSDQMNYAGSEYGLDYLAEYPTYSGLDFNQSGGLSIADMISFVNYRTEYGEEFGSIAEMCAGAPELSDEPICQSYFGSQDAVSSWTNQAGEWLLDAYYNNPNSIQWNNIDNQSELQSVLATSDVSQLTDYLGGDPQAYLDLLGLSQSDFWGDWTQGDDYCFAMAQQDWVTDEMLADYGCM